MKQRLCCSRTESCNSFFYHYLLIFVGHGGTLVDSMPLDRKVVGSNPILAATPGTLGKSFTNSIQVYNIYYILYILYTLILYRPILYTLAYAALDYRQTNSLRGFGQEWKNDLSMQFLNSNIKRFSIATLDWITKTIRIYASIVHTIQMSLPGKTGVYTPRRLAMVGCGAGLLHGCF